MRSTCRLFLAAILFTVVAGFVSAQDPSEAPPPQPPPVVTEPVAELPVIPAAEPEVPAVEPALTADQTAPPVEPVVPAIVEAPAEVPAAPPAVTTVKRVTKKTAKKPAVVLSESLEAATPVASTAAVDTPATPPLDAAASTAPLKSIAPPLPSVQAAAVEGSEETESEYTMGIGGWLIAGLVVAGLFGAITLFRRRQTLKRTSIVDLKTITPELNPALVMRR
jgi:outer membrane biosynthesis protein TonB